MMSVLRSSNLLYLVIAVVALPATSAVIARSKPVRFDAMELCLGCICEATTNCNLTYGCSDGLCGPFLISREYWIDAGTPVVRGDNPYRAGAYERCVIEPYCAATTVRNYMHQFMQDCNRDGKFDCEDVGRIHYLGGYQCNLYIEDRGYYRVFKQCLQSIKLYTDM